MKFKFSSNVEKISITSEKVNDITVNGKKINFDGVIAAADYNHVEQVMLDPKFRNYSNEYWDNREMAPSSLLFYVGLNKKLINVKHHNLFLKYQRKVSHKVFYLPCRHKVIFSRFQLP